MRTRSQVCADEAQRVFELAEEALEQMRGAYAAGDDAAGARYRHLTARRLALSEHLDRDSEVCAMKEAAAAAPAYIAYDSKTGNVRVGPPQRKALRKLRDRMLDVARGHHARGDRAGAEKFLRHAEEVDRALRTAR